MAVTYKRNYKQGRKKAKRTYKNNHPPAPKTTLGDTIKQKHRPNLKKKNFYKNLKKKQREE